MGHYPTGGIRAASRALILCLALLLAVPAWAAGPRRVVSINLCADQVLLSLAPHTLIAGVSLRVDDDPVAAAQARGLPRLPARAEAVLALQPDLVLASQFSSAALVQGLRSFGVPVEQVPDPESLEQLTSLVLQVGQVLGRQRAAAQAIGALQDRLARLRSQPRPDSPLVALYLPNGFTAGAGTMADSLLQHVGLRNLAQEAGMAGYGWLSLEKLLLAAPDWILTIPAERQSRSLAEAKARHPALLHVPGRVQTLPSGGSSCGVEQVAQAAEALAVLAKVSP